jgi:glycosyltransferase involved in cell wall biosynthesis
MAPDFFKIVLDFCLLIPCYNDEPGLIRSLKSVEYDNEKFIVVLVDDGSHTAVDMGILKSSLPHILYMHLIRLPQNRGITSALNTGLQWILENTAVPYIARLDCQDICHEQRFYKQVTFLKAHGNVGLLGSWCTFVEDNGEGYKYTTPLKHRAIIEAMHLRNVFIHPTVMFRAVLLRKAGLYPFAYPYAEDYAFFWKLLQLAEGAMLEESLTTCAIMPQGLSLSNRKAQLLSRKKVVQRFGNRMDLKVIGLIKLTILLMVPKTLLLRLKMRKATVRN